MSDTVKLIVTLNKGQYENLKNIHCGSIGSRMIVNAVMNGIPLDDVKAEVFRQSKQTNETFTPEWNDGFNDGMFHTLTIIGDYYKHIAESEGK